MFNALNEAVAEPLHVPSVPPLPIKHIVFNALNVGERSPDGS
jgi:hypothetical protein